MFTWDDLSFWQSEAWKTVQERLDRYEREGKVYCPTRDKMFAALDATPFEDVRVAIIGQDPYPTPEHATGLAFSVPRMLKLNNDGMPKFPPTLVNIFKEMLSDLHHMPKHGDLTGWAEQGVLLWNAIPTCTAYNSMSHRFWPEWQDLTREIVQSLDGVVIVFMGGVAREFACEAHNSSKVIEVSHPSPRGALIGKHPFIGSRIFSTVNSHLNDMGLKSIEWRLE